MGLLIGRIESRLKKPAALTILMVTVDTTNTSGLIKEILLLVWGTGTVLTHSKAVRVEGGGCHTYTPPHLVVNAAVNLTMFNNCKSAIDQKYHA